MSRRNPEVVTSTFLFLFYNKNNNWLQYKKAQHRAPGTIFSTFTDKVRPEGRHEKCCRFGTLTGVHHGAHIRSANLCSARNDRGLSRNTTSPRKKNGGRRASIGYVVGTFGNTFFFVGSATQVIEGTKTTAMVDSYDDGLFPPSQSLPGQSKPHNCDCNIFARQDFYIAAGSAQQQSHIKRFPL